VLVRDDDVDAVGVVADVLVDPVQLDLQLLGREAHCAQHAETPGLADCDHDIAAVGEGEDRKLDAKLVANRGVHAYSWDARRIESCSSLVRPSLTWKAAPGQRVDTTGCQRNVRAVHKTRNASMLPKQTR